MGYFLIYKRLYFQYDMKRLPVCPITIHALLHIAPGIRKGGPVWSYWEWAMERFCGRLLCGIKSRRYPWTSLDSYAVISAQLAQVTLTYDLSEMLKFKDPSAARSTPQDVVDLTHCMFNSME
jgi:hypothetical protein